MTISAAAGIESKRRVVDLPLLGRSLSEGFNRLLLLFSSRASHDEDLMLTTMAPRTLNFITGNANKLAEVKAILAAANTPVELTSRSVDLPEIQGTIEEITKDKARRAAETVCKLLRGCLEGIHSQMRLAWFAVVDHIV